MSKQKTIGIVSGILVVLVVAVSLIGWGRATMFLRCHWWHAMHEQELRYRGLVVKVPSNWCAIEEDETPLLSMIPASRSDRLVMLLFDSISDQDKRNLMSGGKFPRAITVRGENFQLVSDPLQLDIAGMSATRLHYSTDDQEEDGESLLMWLFPSQDVSALSYKVHQADIEQLDYLVSAFTTAPDS
jgi:hypothetical protein